VPAGGCGDNDGCWNACSAGSWLNDRLGSSGSWSFAWKLNAATAGECIDDVGSSPPSCVRCCADASEAADSGWYIMRGAAGWVTSGMWCLLRVSSNSSSSVGVAVADEVGGRAEGGDIARLVKLQSRRRRRSRYQFYKILVRKSSNFI
jgi:hypothetical protein